MKFRGVNRAVAMVALVIAGAAPGASGCGGGSDLDLNRVSGTVTMDGKPLPHASVIFTPKGGGRPSFGITDEAGRYELGYTMTGMGALGGEYVVSIRTYREAEEDPDTGETLLAVPETVPSVYHSPSTLTVTVPGGSYDFELKSDAGQVVQPLVEPADE